MLVLSRRLNEKIVINGDVWITVVGIQGNQVRIGIEAPDSVGIFRQELYDRFGTNAGRQNLATIVNSNQNEMSFSEGSSR